MNRWKAVSLCLVMVWGLFIPGSAWGGGGDPLWEKQFTFLPQYDTITTSYAALSSTTYILSGNAKNAADTQPQLGFLKAFDVTTGDIKWEKTLSLGATNNNFGSIVINGDIAMVRGSYFTLTGSTMTLCKNFLRAYNADTGELLWEVLRDFEALARVQSGISLPPTLTANNRVFWFTGTVDTSGILDPSTVFVHAYQVRNVFVQSMLLLD